MNSNFKPFVSAADLFRSLAFPRKGGRCSGDPGRKERGSAPGLPVSISLQTRFSPHNGLDEQLPEHRHTKIYRRGSINLLMVTEASMGATFSINMSLIFVIIVNLV